MSRSLLLIASLSLLIGPGLAQDSTSKPTDRQDDQNQQQPATTSQPNDQNQQQQSTKKPNKVKQKLGDLVPDCTNLIFFHGCRSAGPEDDKNDAKQQQRLQEATQRCQQLTTALPPSLAHHASPPPANSTPLGESSSRTGNQPEVHPYCMPEDVLAADHDVEVGDFYFTEQKYRAAEMRYRSALERLPGEPIASLHLARVLEKLGNKSEAAEHYKVFLEWSPTGKDANEAKAAVERLQKETAQK